MVFKSSKVKIAGAFLVIIMTMLFAWQPAYAEHVNGEYTIEFNILHADQKNASIAEGFWNQPATVYIQDGSIRVQTTINKHAWVTHFATSFAGNMSEAKTVSVDETDNLRVTEFPIANFTDLVESNVSVKIDDIDYEHSYTMYFKFKPETLTLVKAEEDVPEQTETPAPAEEPENRPADKPVESPNLEPDPSTETIDQPDSNAVDPSAPVTNQDQEEETEAVEEPSADQGSADEANDFKQQQNDAVEEVRDSNGNESIADDEETNDNSTDSSNEATDDAEEGTSATPDPTDEEEDSNNGNMFTIIVVIVIVFIGIFAFAIYRIRHDKK